MASRATVPIVVAMPAVSDSRTSATIGAELCTQAKPSTEIVSGPDTGRQGVRAVCVRGRPKALHQHHEAGQPDQGVAHQSKAGRGAAHGEWHAADDEAQHEKDDESQQHVQERGPQGDSHALGEARLGLHWWFTTRRRACRDAQ
jgi:hypothetical protein